MNIDDSAAIQTVTAFCNWYLDNMGKLNRIGIVNNAGGNYDSTKFYSINTDSVDYLISQLYYSSFFTDRYVDSLKKYIISCDSLIRKQNDGPPNGLDADLIFNTQDGCGALYKMTNKAIKINPITKGEIQVDVFIKETGDTYSLLLVKQKGKWFIDGH